MRQSAPMRLPAPVPLLVIAFALLSVSAPVAIAIATAANAGVLDHDQGTARNEHPGFSSMHHGVSSADDQIAATMRMLSTLPGEVAKVSRAQDQMMAKIRDTQRRLRMLDDDSARYSASHLMSRSRALQLRQSRVLAEIQASSSRMNDLKRHSKRHSIESEVDDDSDNFAFLEMPEEIASAVPHPRARAVVRPVDDDDDDGEYVSRSHYVFKLGLKGTMDCMCAVLPGQFNKTEHRRLHQMEAVDQQRKARRSCATLTPRVSIAVAPAPADEDVAAGDDGSHPYIPPPQRHYRRQKRSYSPGEGEQETPAPNSVEDAAVDRTVLLMDPVPCFDGCQAHKCRPIFRKSGFDAFHECILECVKRCYGGNEVAMRVAEDAVHVQAQVTAQVKKALSEDRI